MGAVISLFGAGSNAAAIDFEIDFSGVQPGDGEKDTWEKVESVVSRASEILQKLAEYKGCGEEIREAINKPTEENEERAWNAILPAVDQLKEFYDFSSEISNQAFLVLMGEFCKEDPKEAISTHPALAKQLAQVFDFVIRFDDLKMVNPAIQNDFSYYRRTLNRMKLKVKGGGADLKIKDELANRMSLFFAYPTPMMNSIIGESGQKFSAEQVNLVTKALAVMAMVCQQMVKGADSQGDLFCLRCMVGSLILYDHLHQQGVFRRNADVDIKLCITTVKEYQAQETQSLVNVLRFTNMHLNDPQTPAAIKHLLE